MSSSSTKFGRTAWTFTWESLGRPSAFARPTAHRRPFNFHSAHHQQRPLLQSNVRRNFSSGLLLLGLDTSGTSSQKISEATAAAESSIIGGTITRAGPISRTAARQAWACSFHTSSGSPGRSLQRRLKSTNTGEGGKSTAAPQKPSQSEAQKISASDGGKNKVGPQEEHHDSLTDSVSKYLHLPKMPHRPTKEELLAAATGFWQRLRVRFKWFSIRSTRPFNADEWGAFLSWILFGHFVWILVGTTTFVSLLILMVNTVFAQGTYSFPSSID